MWIKDMNEKKALLEKLAIPDIMQESLERKGGFEALLEAIPDDDELVREVLLHKALSDPIRLRIMHALTHTDICPCVLKEIGGITDSKLSYHLSRLEGAGLIKYDKEKNWRLYHLTPLGLYVIRGH